MIELRVSYALRDLSLFQSILTLFPFIYPSALTGVYSCFYTRFGAGWDLGCMSL